MNDIGWCFVYFQYTPKDNIELKGILVIENDKIFYYAKDIKKELQANPILSNGQEISNNRPQAYLKQLSLQSSMSQITYEYTEDNNRVLEYLQTL